MRCRYMIKPYSIRFLVFFPSSPGFFERVIDRFFMNMQVDGWFQQVCVGFDDDMWTMQTYDVFVYVMRTIRMHMARFYAICTVMRGGYRFYGYRCFLLLTCDRYLSCKKNLFEPIGAISMLSYLQKNTTCYLNHHH